jgi:hypothetical protein
MTQPPLKITGAFRAVAYILLSYAAIQVVLDLLSSMQPMLPKLVAWRIRAEGLAAGQWTLPALMILLMCFVAVAAEDRKVLLALAVAAATSATVLMVTSVLFGLDAIEMNRSVPPGGKKAYAISAAYAMARLGVGILTFTLLTWASGKAARSLKRASASSRKAVLMGATPAPSA